MAQGFQIIWPQNSVDLLKFIEHNPRIWRDFLTGMSTVSIYVAISINLMNISPLYAFINTHSTMDVSVQDMRMALWFLNMRWGRRKISPFVCVSTPTNILITLRRRRSRKPCLPTSKSGSTFCTPGHSGRANRISQKPGCLCFYDFSAEYPPRRTSLFRSPSGFVARPHRPHGSGRVHRADVWRGTGIYRYQRNIDVEQNCGYVRRAIRQYAVDRPQLS